MLCRVALVRTDVSENLSASFIRVTRIYELGTTLAVTRNRSKLGRNTKWYTTCHPDEGGAKILQKRQFLQEPHDVAFQKTPFFIVTAVKTSNIT
jgi:hypothetical protein